jgi:GTP cyclohydrolase I
MNTDRRFLVEVGMNDLPFPVRVLSRESPEGQTTVANISISARIMREFEARWIDTFTQVVHQHRDRISTETLEENIADYVQALHASSVAVTLSFPFFYEKTLPVSKERCLVRYMCKYTVRANCVMPDPKTVLTVDVPVLTTYPASQPDEDGGLFGQLTIFTLDVEAQKHKEVFPEDLIDLADRCALAPMYAYLTEEDQVHVIRQTHSEYKPSVVVLDEIKKVLARDRDIAWYAIRGANYGMLHPYSTVIGTEKSMWVPFSGCDSNDI